MTENLFNDFALQYAEMGLPVLPLRPGTKEAFLPGGYKVATTDKTKIEMWCKEYPHSNIAWRTGKGVATVIDIDPRHGGFETAQALAERGQGFPNTVESRTVQGGKHLFYAYEPSLKTGNDRLGPGIDIKNDGGYIVVAPSYWDGTHPSKGRIGDPGEYCWVRPPLGLNFPRMPKWIIERLKRRSATPKTNWEASEPDDLVIEEALRYIPNTDYEIWKDVGMALESGLGEAGFALWDNWSRGYADYDHRTCKAKWKSFRGSGITLGTLFYHAKQHGAPLAEIRQNARQTEKG